jgi:sigma-B regulation protein RsbU (phosphoserine phosphatase)
MAFVDARKYEAPGDTLLAYTDGITEARDRQGKLFGEEQLLRLVGEYARNSAVALLDRIEEAVGEYTDGAAPSDDRAVLALKRN